MTDQSALPLPPNGTAEELGVYNIIKEFYLDSSRTEYRFDATLSGALRKVAHEIAEAFKLSHISRGEGSNRFIVLNKAIPGTALVHDPSNWSTTLRKRWAKDFSLPINVVQSPYFEYYIDLYEPLLKSKTKFGYLVDGIKELGSESAFWAYQSKLFQDIIDSIKSSEAYKQLMDSNDHATYAIKDHIGHCLAGKIYRPEWNGAYMISLDMISANFSSLKYYNPALVRNCTSWNEFLSQFTSIKYFHESKFFRQLVFGSLNTKKQQIITKYIIQQVLKGLVQDAGLRLPIATLIADEAVFLSSESMLSEDVTLVARLLQEKVPALASLIRIEPFRLKQIHPSKAFYVKESFSKDQVLDKSWKPSEFTPSFKGVPPHFFAQAFKYYYGRPIEEVDRKVSYEGYTATLDHSIFDTTNETDIV